MAGIHLLSNGDNTDSCFCFAVNNRPVYRCGAAVFQQKRRMDIDRSFRRQISQFSADLLAESNDDNQVRLITGNLFDDIGSIYVICLDKRYRMHLRPIGDLCRVGLSAPAGRIGWLRDDKSHIMLREAQSIQAFNTEFAAAEIYDFHYYICLIKVEGSYY